MIVLGHFHGKAVVGDQFLLETAHFPILQVEGANLHDPAQVFRHDVRKLAEGMLQVP